MSCLNVVRGRYFVAISATCFLRRNTVVGYLTVPNQFLQEKESESDGAGATPRRVFIPLYERRARLTENGEAISDERFQDIMLRGITIDYDYIRDTSYR